MVVIRISYHLLNSIWAQIGHELIMNVGENILHGADLLQIFYSAILVGMLGIFHNKKVKI